MTGFGLGNAPLGGGRIAVEVRAVNGRFLEVRVRVPQELVDLSPIIETEARKRLSRGRCDIGVRAEGPSSSAGHRQGARPRRVPRARRAARRVRARRRRPLLDALGRARPIHPVAGRVERDLREGRARGARLGARRTRSPCGRRKGAPSPTIRRAASTRCASSPRASPAARRTCSRCRRGNSRSGSSRISRRHSRHGGPLDPRRASGHRPA